MKEQTNIRLDRDVYRKLKILAAKMGLTLSGTVKELLKK